MRIDKEFLLDGQSVIDIVVVVLPGTGPCTSRNVVVEILVFDMIQHTEGVDIYLGGCYGGMICEIETLRKRRQGLRGWCGDVLVELVDVEDIVVLRS